MTLCPPLSGLRLIAAATALLLAQANALAADGYVTTNETQLDTIYSQTIFGANTVDIRFLSFTSIVNASLTIIDSANDWNTLLGLSSNLASPIVNMYFVDKVQWCGSPGTSIVGCAQGNLQALDSAYAAGANGGVLAAHELGHNLGLSHFSNGTNLMNPTLSSSFALTSAQVSTLLASSLIQTDAGGRYIEIQPIAVLAAAAVPEPSQWALLLLGGGLLAGARRARRG
jgi:hypothetical protein